MKADIAKVLIGFAVGTAVAAILIFLTYKAYTYGRRRYYDAIPEVIEEHIEMGQIIDGVNGEVHPNVLAQVQMINDLDEGQQPIIM